MSYGITYGEHAFDDLLDLEPPDSVVDCIERWILLLASQPIEHYMENETEIRLVELRVGKRPLP